MLALDVTVRKDTHISLAERAMWSAHRWRAGPELELVLTSATQVTDHNDMFLARSGEAVLRVRQAEFHSLMCCVVASASSDAIPHGVRPGCGTQSEGVIYTFCRGREILLLEYYRTGSSNPNLRKN